MKKDIFFVDFVVVFNARFVLYINNKFEDHYPLCFGMEGRGGGAKHVNPKLTAFDMFDGRSEPYI